MVRLKKLPPLPSIRAFEAAARLGSFARAAQELGTTAASVSYHVRQLERQTGLHFFCPSSAQGRVDRRRRRNRSRGDRRLCRTSCQLCQSAGRGRITLVVDHPADFGDELADAQTRLFRMRHPHISIELELSAEAQPLGDGRFDAAVRHGLGDWHGLQSVRLFPILFTPLCAPALKDAVRGLENPGRPLDVPLLGRPDLWNLWYRALGATSGPPIERFGTSLAAEHLDIAAAIAGHGVAIGSPILFATKSDRATRTST